MAVAEIRSAYTLDGARIISTLEQLQARICDRFPDSGLSQVCADLVRVARRTEEAVEELKRPYWEFRLPGYGFMAAAVAAVIAVTILVVLHVQSHPYDAVALTQGLESAVNLTLLGAAGAWYVATWETRIKRRKAHDSLSELRGIAHVIDMHQLTKDPTVVLGGKRPTAASPKREMTEFELARYLDYCAEMLALIAKLAALYQRAHSDPEIGAAVNEVEGLTSDLGRKIWQKITIIGQLADRGSPSAGPA